MIVEAPRPPRASICIGVTGHRAGHPSMKGRLADVEATLAYVLEVVESAAAEAAGYMPLRRLITLLADGADQAAARSALDRGWELGCPMPFGRRLNAAINAGADTLEQARTLLAGGRTGDADIDGNVAAIGALAARASLLELADSDARIERLLLAHLGAHDREAGRIFAAETSRRVALAGEILIEQSDLIIAVWDGETTAHVGGTGDTMALALDRGAPVVWIDPSRTGDLCLLHAPEALSGGCLHTLGVTAEPELRRLVRSLILPDAARGNGRPLFSGPASLGAEQWHRRSNPLAHGYRRIEALFGDQPGRARFRSIHQTYERPDAIGSGSAAPLLAELRALPGGPAGLPDRLDISILRRFAWADGISSRLSDSYRGGMVVNFILAGLAIVGGIAYLPLVDSHYKWPFATFELLLLVTILGIADLGRRHRWHGRWLETRRVAEYLRHSALLQIVGVARPPGRWPRGTETSWPEWYALQSIREVGLPVLCVTQPYLRAVLSGPVAGHVASQRAYHFAKSRRLKTVDRNLDRVADRLFLLAVISVAFYLVLKLGVLLGAYDGSALDNVSKIFTVLGVVFPTFGSAIAGIRYFGDFERFAAISEITAEKLDAILRRIDLLLSAPDAALDYGLVAELARATDDTVVAEIENWQSVFGGKHITIPV